MDLNLLLHGTVGLLAFIGAITVIFSTVAAIHSAFDDFRDEE